MTDVKYDKKDCIISIRFGGNYEFDASPEIDGGESTSGMIIDHRFIKGGAELIVRTEYGTLLSVFNKEINGIQKLKS